jgi:hypothetical protein
MATLRNLAIATLYATGFTNLAEGLRWASHDFTRPSAVLGLTLQK